MNRDNQIPVVDFGGTGLSFHFAHANAYPPRCYRQFLEPLSNDYHVWAMAQRPLWPGADPAALTSWHLFAADFLDLLSQRGEERLVAAGHSLGAVVSMMAANQQPQRFAALVLVEPVLLPPAILQAAREYPEQAEQMPLAQRARNRRHRWDNRRQAFERFRSKKVFRGLSDEALRDYVNHGLEDMHDGKVQLRFPREWEARIYGRPPLDIWDILPRLRVPTLAIRGENSDTITPEAWRRWQELQPAAEFIEVKDAGHLVPMERPAELAQLTQTFLQQRRLI